MDILQIFPRNSVVKQESVIMGESSLKETRRCKQNISFRFLFSAAVFVCYNLAEFPVSAASVMSRASADGAPVETPCPSSECDCWNSGSDVHVRCTKSSETGRVPRFDDTSVTFGSLSLARFNLTSIPEKSFQHVRAKALDLNGNQFSKVGLIADGAFSGISSSLHVLSLADCELQRVPPALSHLAHLRTLHLENNKISIIQKTTFRKNSKLRHLFLNRNQLKKIDNNSFDSVSHLDELKLSENQLQSIQPHLFSKLSKLMNLDLSHNFIYMLHPGTFAGLRKLFWLDIRSNLLHVVSRQMFTGLRSLVSLKLEGNRLLDIAAGTFSDMKPLQYLSIEFSANTTINSATFRGMSKLQTLNFGEINRERFPPSVFQAMKRLTYLSFNGYSEQVHRLPAGAFPGRNELQSADRPGRYHPSMPVQHGLDRQLVARGTAVHGLCGSKEQIQC